MQGKTKSGFKYDVDERILSDWRFTLAVTKGQNGSTDLEKLAAVNEMIELLLGKEGSEKLMTHVAKKHEGFVPAPALMAEVNEIFENVRVKN